MMRAAIYIRVSSEEQVEGYSLDAQRRAAEHYAAAQNWDLVGEYRDEGRSARTDDLSKRPAFQRMLADAEAGRFDVLIVHKLDRFARNIMVTLDTLKRLERAGVGFTSISEQIDFASPIGKVLLAMLAAFAQYYSDNLSNETKKGKHERRRQGMYNGILPFGVKKGPDGVPVLDRDPVMCRVDTREELSRATGLQTAFHLAQAGRTDRDIAQDLNGMGFRTTGNRGQNPFTKDSVRAILTNRFYIGEIPDGSGGTIPARHGPLIDQHLFDQVQDRRAETRSHRHRRRTTTATRSPWSLSGIAVCAVCGKPITSAGINSGKRRVMCSGRTQGTGCTETSFLVEVIDRQIAGILEAFTASKTVIEASVAEWAKREQALPQKQDQRQLLKTRLDRLREVYLQGDLSAGEYQERRDQLQQQLAALPVESMSRPALLDTARRGARLSNLSQLWTDAGPEERNRIARELFVAVLVEKQQAVAVVPRPELRPFFGAAFGVSAPNIWNLRKRRASTALVPEENDLIGMALWVPDPLILNGMRDPGTRYSIPRERKLTAAQERMIQRESSSKSLRDQAAEWDISHELVRLIRLRA